MDLETLRDDRKEVKAAARGAAPPPPPKGSKQAAPAPVSDPVADDVPLKVLKYRAIQSFAGKEGFSFDKGATIFVIGDVDAHGEVMGVVNGKTGEFPFKLIVEITPELLKEERVQKEKEAEEARKREMSRIEAAEAAATTAAPQPAAAAPSSASKTAAAATPAPKAVNEAFEKQRADALAKEQALKAEAARIEAMLAALDDD